LIGGMYQSQPTVDDFDKGSSSPKNGGAVFFVTFYYYELLYLMTKNFTLAKRAIVLVHDQSRR